MARYTRFWFLLALVSAAALWTGYKLPHRPKRNGDLLDAVSSVQRRCPLYLFAEPGVRPYSWPAAGGIYLSRTSKTTDELDHLIKDPDHYRDSWEGVVYFNVLRHRDHVLLPFLGCSGMSDQVLDYGNFAVYGDRVLLRQVRSILAEEAFEVLQS